MNVYDDALSLGAARAQYFARSGFDESSYVDRWVRLQAGPLRLWLPNTAARVRAVRLHDLHHVVTGYDTSWTGEAEIGAWELASGCADHYAAWFLNLSAMITVLLAAVAVAMAARRYAARHLDSIALMKCMGAPQRLVLQVTVIELAAVALIAAAVGAVLGYFAQALLARLLGGVVQGDLPPPTLAPAWLGAAT